MRSSTLAFVALLNVAIGSLLFGGLAGWTLARIDSADELRAAKETVADCVKRLQMQPIERKRK
jgi:hypothetical protein